MRSLLLLVHLILLTPLAHAALPAYEQVRADYLVSEGVLLDRNGELIHELRVDANRRVLPWVRLDQVSPVLLRTLIRAEDRRFYEHGGVDWLALAAAASNNLTSSSKRGASTLTMQLAGRLDRALRPVGTKRSVTQKWFQMRAAWEIEAHWTKTHILEAYLNLASFRGELGGVHAAAQGLFGKSPGALDEAESLLLVALLRSPNAKPDAIATRACGLARPLAVSVSCDDLRALATASLAAPPRIAQGATLAPEVARLLLSRHAPQVRSSLDAGLQRFARASLESQLALLGAQQVADGAVLAVDNATGEVLAYVGNSGASSSARFVDGVRAPRQAGSTLKPFLYCLALEQRLLTSASLLDDSPVNLVTPSGLYVPQNYDREFHGPVTVRTALAASLNVPAVRTLMLVGADAFVERLRALGFRGITEDGDYYGFALALGSAEVDLWQLVNAYRTLANGGQAFALSLVPRAEAAEQAQVMNAAAAWIVSDVLADRGARGLTFGLDNPLATRYWSAVKTGTSKDMRDNWCVGYSQRYTVGVWVGNFGGEPMRNVSGVSGAAPVWLAVMNALHEGRESRPAPRADGVIAAEVAFSDGVETRRTEYFLAGTETAVVQVKRASTALPRIAYPATGAVIAFDPDIPAASQRVVLRMQPKAPGYRWRVNGSAIESRDGLALWAPQQGRHRLDLVDSSGILVDEVEFEVRGASTIEINALGRN